MYWLFTKFRDFYQENKGKRLTLMTVPGGRGEVKTISIPVLGIYFGTVGISMAVVLTLLTVWNYYMVRGDYTATFDLLQKKNNQYEAVLDTSKEQKEVVETLIDETELLRTRIKQLENAFGDVNRLLEQTGKRPVQLPPVPERQVNDMPIGQAGVPVFADAGFNRSGIDQQVRDVSQHSMLMFSGIALAKTASYDYYEKTNQEVPLEYLLNDLQKGVSSLEASLKELEKTNTGTYNKLVRLKYEQDHTPSIWPAKAYISSYYGWRMHPVLNERKKHTGLDIAVIKGTPVKATADGVITTAGWVAGYGMLVQIDHGNGISTLYGHNSRIVVKKGDSVKKGQLISYSGNTGISTGDHLHYEVRVNGQDVNPLNYLP